MKILLPLPEVKRFCRCVQSVNEDRTLNYTTILDHTCRFLGFYGYADYQASLKSHRPGDYRAASSLSLYEMEHKAKECIAFFSELNIDLPPHTFQITGHASFETPFRRHIDHQLANLDSLPSLRMSGALYLLSFFWRQSIYEPDTWSLDAGTFKAYVIDVAIPEPIFARMKRYSEKNKAENLRYHEGLLLDIILRMKWEGIEREGFKEQPFIRGIREIRDILQQEKAFIQRATLGEKSLDDVRFSFPLPPEDPERLDIFAELANVRKYTDLHNPLLLGIGKQPTNFLGIAAGPPPTLTLSGKDIRENILIPATCGSGSQVLGIGILRQAIMNRSGGIFFDGRGTPAVYWHLKSILKAHGREDDLVFLSLSHQDQLDRINLKALIESNKIILISFPALEKDPEALGSGVFRFMKAILSGIGGIDEQKMSQYFPCVLILDEIIQLIRDREAVDWFLGFAAEAQRKKIGIIATSQCPPMPEEVSNRLFGVFKHKLLMKNEGIFEFPTPELTDADRKKVLLFQPGEFMYLNGAVDSNKAVYTTPYLIPDYQKTHSYLTMC